MSYKVELREVLQPEAVLPRVVPHDLGPEVRQGYERLHEGDLRKPVHSFFKRKNYQLHDEIRLFSRPIDVVAKKKSKIITIELKIRDWRRAIEQASLDLRVSNYSYVALPEAVIGRLDRRMYYEAYINGIGLISVDGNAKIIMKPERSEKIQPLLRRRFLKRLREGCNK